MGIILEARSVQILGGLSCSKLNPILYSILQSCVLCVCLQTGLLPRIARALGCSGDLPELWVPVRSSRARQPGGLLHATVRCYLQNPSLVPKPATPSTPLPKAGAVRRLGARCPLLLSIFTPPVSLKCPVESGALRR